MTMRPHGPLTIAAICALSAAGAARPADAQPAADAVIGQAARFAITRAELTDELVDARRSGDLARVAEAMSAEGVERMLRALADRKRLAAEARDRGLDRRPDVARELTRLRDRMLADVLQGLTRAQVDTSDAAVERYFEAHGDEFRSAPRTKARHIVTATEAEARAALAEVRGGRAFADVARARNIDSTKGTGGDLGWVPRGAMVAPFDAALFRLEGGSVSDVVQTSFGWHLILAEELDPGAMPPLGLVKDRVIERMKARAFDELKDRLRAEQPLAVDREAVLELLK